MLPRTSLPPSCVRATGLLLYFRVCRGHVGRRDLRDADPWKGDTSREGLVKGDSSLISETCGHKGGDVVSHKDLFVESRRCQKTYTYRSPNSTFDGFLYERCYRRVWKGPYVVWDVQSWDRRDPGSRQIRPTDRTIRVWPLLRLDRFATWLRNWTVT